MNLKVRYSQILIDKLPANIKKELEFIKEETENFSNSLTDLYSVSFDYIYEYIEKNNPDCLLSNQSIKVVKGNKRIKK